MNYNLITPTSLFPNGGRIWQGGTVDSDVLQIPGPLVLVCMNHEEVDDSWIDHKTIQALLAVSIDDNPNAILPDDVLIGLADSIIALLKSGINVLIHCAAGVSRASYMDIAVHMRVLKIPYQSAFDKVHSQRPVISPNSGFEAHLRALEARLIGGQ